MAESLHHRWRPDFLGKRGQQDAGAHRRRRTVALPVKSELTVSASDAAHRIGDTHGRRLGTARSDGTVTGGRATLTCR